MVFIHGRLLCIRTNIGKELISANKAIGFVSCKLYCFWASVNRDKWKNLQQNACDDMEETVDRLGFRRFTKDGRLHRDDDMPALISDNGTQTWFQNGKVHRENDKPAVMFAKGSCKWFMNNLPHRLDGKPSELFTRLDLSTYSEIPGPSWTERSWHVDGLLHRDDDRPAKICEDGAQAWWVHGRLHRSDATKPTIMRPSGEQLWYRDDFFRRSTYVTNFKDDSQRFVFLKMAFQG